MQSKSLPDSYKGYPVSELLQVLKELQGQGTKAPEEKILAMDELVHIPEHSGHRFHVNLDSDSI